MQIIVGLEKVTRSVPPDQVGLLDAVASEYLTAMPSFASCVLVAFLRFGLR